MAASARHEMVMDWPLPVYWAHRGSHRLVWCCPAVSLRARMGAHLAPACRAGQGPPPAGAEQMLVDARDRAAGGLQARRALAGVDLASTPARPAWGRSGWCAVA